MGIAVDDRISLKGLPSNFASSIWNFLVSSRARPGLSRFGPNCRVRTTDSRIPRKVISSLEFLLRPYIPPLQNETPLVSLWWHLNFRLGDSSKSPRFPSYCWMTCFPPQKKKEKGKESWKRIMKFILRWSFQLLTIKFDSSKLGKEILSYDNLFVRFNSSYFWNYHI